MKNILVTGGSGQIGKDLQNIVKNSDLKFYFPSSSEFNLTDENSISSIYDDFTSKQNLFSPGTNILTTDIKIIEKFKPDLIHAVAMKPIIYSGIVARYFSFSYSSVFSFAGLGYIFISQKLIVKLYLYPNKGPLPTSNFSFPPY